MMDRFPSKWKWKSPYQLWRGSVPRKATRPAGPSNRGIKSTLNLKVIKSEQDLWVIHVLIPKALKHASNDERAKVACRRFTNPLSKKNNSSIIIWQPFSKLLKRTVNFEKESHSYPMPRAHFYQKREMRVCVGGRGGFLRYEMIITAELGEDKGHTPLPFLSHMLLYNFACEGFSLLWMTNYFRNYLLNYLGNQGLTGTNHYVNLNRKWQSKTPIGQKSCHKNLFQPWFRPDTWALGYCSAICS